jgi:hypothetical protein
MALSKRKFTGDSILAVVISHLAEKSVIYIHGDIYHFSISQYASLTAQLSCGLLMHCLNAHQRFLYDNWIWQYRIGKKEGHD